MMQPTPRALPDWSAVPSNSEDDRVLMNLRLAYFARAIFAVTGAFYVFMRLLGMARGLTLWEQIIDVSESFHAAGAGVCAVEWALCRKGRRSALALNVIDVCSVMLSMLCFSLMVAVEPHGLDQALVLVLTAMAILGMRAVIVPGTARRTFWITSLAHLPLLAASYYVLSHASIPSLFERANWGAISITIYIGMWAVVTISMCTLASRTIYGLAQRVREALQLGQYTLEAKIGEGGMGVVFRARHAFLRRPTAVKLLPLARAGERGLARFEREVQLTSILTHPNTVAIYDFGHTPEGVFYYAMEYLDGLTLEELVEHDGPQPAARVGHLLRQIAGALEEAHGVGLIHRDIKPSNVVLCVHGGIPDHVKVLDFGLVKELGVSGEPNLSGADAIVGTPHYLAPESIARPEEVDGRADLYSLGALAYYLLTGTTVFEDSSVFGVCAKHLSEVPEPPSRRGRREVPAALESLVLACLAKRPQDRPPTAAAFLERLSCADGLEPWSEANGKRWWAERGNALVASTRAVRETDSASRSPHSLVFGGSQRPAAQAR